MVIGDAVDINDSGTNYGKAGMMMEQTLFERMNITYEEKDGLYYPVLDTEGQNLHDINIAEAGKYGRRWMQMLFDNERREYYRRWMAGTLVRDATEINEEVYGLIELLTEREISKCSMEQRLSTLYMRQIREDAKIKAEEIVIEDLTLKIGK